MAEQLPGLLRDLPGYLSAHVLLVLVALSIGAAISIPLAILLTRKTRLQLPVLSSAGVIQTVPSLALLALMVPILDGVRRLGVDVSSFGFLPAAIALTLYSMLPILRNTVAGISQVDPAMIEAARGVGMTSMQRLWKVELPLSAPVILAGVRTATVWVVGIATLSTPIGQPSLGNYIFVGLNTEQSLMVLWGVIFAAGLALVMDGLIAATQRAAEQRSKPKLITLMSTAVVLAVLSIGSPTWLALLAPDAAEAGPAIARTDDPEPAEVGTITIGGKNFTEQYLLARVMERQLRGAGYQTQRLDTLDSSTVFRQLVDEQPGTVDVYIDYSGTLWANHMKREGGDKPWRVLSLTSGWLAKEHNVRQLGTIGFENAYALVMRCELAQERGIESVADLARHNGELSIAGSLEFFERPEWDAVLSTYGLAFKEERQMSATNMYKAVQRGAVDVISAFSSDGRIAAYDLVVLDEPANVFPPYDAVLLLGPRVANYPRLVETLMPLVNSISLKQMQRANQRVDVDKRSLDEAARELYDRLSK